MSVDQIKKELANLPKEQQDHLAAFLVHLRHQRDTNYGQELARRIDDKTPENWLLLSDLKKKWND